jgi:hypothetical protein
MRILVLAALLGSGLCAQTEPVKPFEPAPEPPAATPVQTSNPAPWQQKQELNRRFFSPPTQMLVTPNNKGGRVWRAIIPYVSGHLKLAPGRACAIPLLQVLPRGGFTGDPKIAILGSQTLANIDHMPLIKVVPVCPQDER